MKRIKKAQEVEEVFRQKSQESRYKVVGESVNVAVYKYEDGRLVVEVNDQKGFQKVGITAFIPRGVESPYGQYDGSITIIES